MKGFKVIGVISSARLNGNTATLVREALKGAEQEGAVTKEIFLASYHLNFCTGCFKCLADGKCPLPDDFSKIRDLLYDADAVIWGSPTYCGTYNAIMKNFIDRLGMYEVMTSSLGGKYFVGISSAGSINAAKKVAKSLVSLTSNGVFKRGYVSGILGAGFTKSAASEDENTLRKAQELGIKICKDLKNGKRYPGQNLLSRLVNRFIVKPQFIKYIVREKDNNTRAVYTNLIQRRLIEGI